MVFSFSTLKLDNIFTEFLLINCRLVRNPLGSTHPEATLKACLEHGAPEDAVQAAKAEFHAHLASNKNQQTNYELVEDSELLSEDRELDSDNQGIIYYVIKSTKCFSSNFLCIYFTRL